MPQGPLPLLSNFLWLILSDCLHPMHINFCPPNLESSTFVKKRISNTRIFHFFGVKHVILKTRFRKHKVISPKTSLKSRVWKSFLKKTTERKHSNLKFWIFPAEMGNFRYFRDPGAKFPDPGVNLGKISECANTLMEMGRQIIPLSLDSSILTSTCARRNIYTYSYFSLSFEFKFNLSGSSTCRTPACWNVAEKCEVYHFFF